MLNLLKQNPTIRTLPRWLGLSAVPVALIVNLNMFIALGYKQTFDPLVMLAVVWFSFTIFLVFGELTRCSPFEMALPIPAKRLWLAHVSAVVISGAVMLAVTGGLVAGGNWLLWRLSGRWMVPVEEMRGLAVHLCAGLLLAVALLQSPLPPVHRLPRSAVRVVLVMAATLALVVVLNAIGAWTALLTLSLAAAVGLHRYRRVPRAFTLSTAGETVAGPVSRDEITAGWKAHAAASTPRGAVFARLLHRTIFRCFYVGAKRKFSPWLTFPFIALFGALLSVLDTLWFEDSQRFLYVPMTVYVLISFSAHPLGALYLLDGLPVSRRRVWNILVIPYLAVLLAGYGLGAAVVALRADTAAKGEVIHFLQNKRDGNTYLYIPASAMKIAWDGEIPKTTSPWGETHEAWSKPLHRWCRVRLYSPYHTPSGSSLEFVAWQMSRATEAVYGEALDPDEIASRYLEKRTDGSVGLRGERLTIQKDNPHLRRIHHGGPVFPFLFGSVFVLWMAASIVYMQTLRGGVAKRTQILVMWALMGAMLVWWFVPFVLAVTHVADPEIVTGFLVIVFGRIGASAWATLLVWGAAIALSVAAYALALGRFARVEVIREEV